MDEGLRMEFRQLYSFYTIATTSSFTRTAEILGYAQSSITTQIQLLEEELNTKLFDRLGKRVVMTNEGQCFFNYVKQILALSNEAKEAVSGSTTPKGSITIGAPESLCAMQLPMVLQEYHTVYPYVKIKLKMGSYNDFQCWLKSNLIDVGLFFQRRINQPELIIMPLAAEPIIAVARPDHPLRDKGRIEPDDLLGESLILPEKGCSYRMILENILSRANIYPETIIELGSVMAMMQCAKSGLGITFLPRFAVAKELEAGNLIDLHWAGEDFGTVIQLAYHKDKWLSPALHAFLAITQKYLGKDEENQSALIHEIRRT